MTAFFRRMAAHEAYFKQHGQRVTYEKGQTFVRPEDENPWVYFLDSGLVEIGYGFNDGTHRLMGYFFPGIVFAQNGLFFTSDGSGLEYTAIKHCVLYRLVKTEFFDLITNNPACNQEYMDLLMRNQFLLIERVAYMGERSIEKVVIRLLLSLSKYYGRQDGNSYYIDVPITQEAVARFAHATRESVSKTLRLLVNEKIISIKAKRLVILDAKKLQQLLEA